MTTQETTQNEESAFLQNQRRVMAQKEQLDRDLEQRQKYTLTPGANEKHDPKAKYVVETHDSTNNTVERRVITPLPTAQRLQPPAPIEKGELTEMIESLRQEMGEQQSRFDHKDELDAERNEKRAALSSKIGDLTLQLREAQSELDQLNREGSIRQQFIAFAQQAEGRITAIANGVYKYLLEKISQERHDSDYKSLPPLLSEDVRFRVDKLGTRFLTQPSFSSLHRTPTEQITNARIEATLEKVYAATERLEGALEK